jgi:hypothetical protein
VEGKLQILVYQRPKHYDVMIDAISCGKA